jgi:catechol 2,3-dioxygenase
VTQSDSLPEETSVQQVVLRVPALADVLPFYRRGLGLAIESDGERAWVSAGDEVLLVIQADPDAADRSPASAGLYHVALRVPSRRELGAALARLRSASYELDGAADHVASEALYLRDPAGNGLEIYADRPREAWEYTAEGEVRLPGDPLDLSTIETSPPAEPGDTIHRDTDIGHVHLEVTDLDESATFYASDLAFNRRRHKPRATFLAGGEYHHHLALNTRGGRTAPYDPNSRGLTSVALSLPEADYDAALDRFRRRDLQISEEREGITVTDPDGIPIRFVPR